MNQKSELTQKTSLKQHLSPVQVQFVRLLEMSGAEIEDAVRDALEENPALEAVGDDDITDRESESSEGVNEETFSESAEQLQAADYGDEDEVPPYLSGASNLPDEGVAAYVMEQHHDSPSLMESLNAQLDVVDAPVRDVAIARHLIGYLDDNGRLSRSLRDIADDLTLATGIDFSRNDLLPALDIIRYELEPPGLGAFDLRECLLIQLRRRQPMSLPLKAATEIVEHNFDLFTKKHFDKLRTTLGVDRQVLDSALDIIRSLDPKPGSSLVDEGASKAAHITPDFIVTPVDGQPDRFSVTLNQRVPALAVEQSFMVEPRDSAARMFVRRCRDEANTFISLIRRRSDTLMAVMQAIVRVQHRFFETEDESDLRPMILNDLSEMTGFDRSVISRATSGKYVATPGGVYPLKMFFNDRPTEDGETSSSQVAAALRRLIDNEDKHRPLSDEALTAALNELGYGLARRTVTKYRERNNIPVARLRKES